MVGILDLPVFGVLGYWIARKFRKSSDCKTSTVATRRHEITLDLQDSGSSLYLKLKKALESRPSVLSVELISLSNVPQDTCLSIYELLVNRNPAIRYEVSIQTSLYDGSILIALPANQITVRRNAWLQIDDLVRLQSKDWSEDEDMFGRRRFASIQTPTFVTDYEAVWREMSQYIDCKSIADKRVPLKDLLGEFGLLQSENIDLKLQELFSGKEVKGSIK